MACSRCSPSSRATAGDLARAVGRFSTLAAWCLAAVGVSGVFSAAVRLPSLADLLGTRYGQFVLVKVALLLAAGWAGWRHRRATLPRLRAGDRRAFVRVAAVELLVFAAALGAAVALSRTPAPAGADSDDIATVAARLRDATAAVGRRAGDPLAGRPAHPRRRRRAGRRLPRRGPCGCAAAATRWPAGRTAAFLAGCAVLAVATCSGVARYAPVLFSVHMVEHLLLAMVAPVLLVLGAPVTLALRALPATTTPPGPARGSGCSPPSTHAPARLFTHPLVALGVYVVSMYAFYFTDLFELALRSHAAHLLMVGHFIARRLPVLLGRGRHRPGTPRPARRHRSGWSWS